MSEIRYKTIPIEHLHHSLFQICTDRYTKISFDKPSTVRLRGECITATLMKGILPEYYRLRGPGGVGTVIRISRYERRRKITVLLLRRKMEKVSYDDAILRAKIERLSRNRRLEK